jgi:predicted metalloprotease
MRRQMIVLSVAGCLLIAACGSSSPGLSAARSTSGTAAVATDTSSPDTSNSGTSSPDTSPGTSAASIPDSSASSPSTVDTSTADSSASSSSSVDTSSNSDVSLPHTSMAPPSSVVANPSDATINFGVNKTPQPYDTFLQASLGDVQDYWRKTYPEVYGAPFTNLAGGIWASYPNRQEAIPDGCPKQSSQQYPAQGNAFYCTRGDYIVYDDAMLIPRLTKEFGESAVGVVFAHEFGHAIQKRVGALGPSTPTIFIEQQADCFAGAWTAHVARGESSRLKFGDQDIKAGLSAMVAVKDGTLGEDVFKGDAHGSAFDRVGAFENGFKGGAVACKAMETNPLPLLDLPFSSQQDKDTGGNLAYDKILPEVEKALNRFWAAGVTSFSPPTVTTFAHSGPFPTCDGIDQSAFPFNAVYCPKTNAIFLDEGYAKTLYNKYGDFAVGYIISNAWSEAVQTQLGSNLAGEQRLLIDDCLTGAWTKDAIPPADGNLDPTRLYISPGDLDKAVETALLSDAGIGNGKMASAFEKIDNFRAGVIGGITECNNRISGTGS